MPRVFVSYSRDDDALQAWVEGLAARLREDGVDARFDLWDHPTGQTIEERMNSEVRAADFVLVVGSPGYRAKVEAREDGTGSSAAAYEAMLLGVLMLDDNRRKLIPIVARGERRDALPLQLRGLLAYDLQLPMTFERHYRALLQVLLGVAPSAPTLGKPPTDLAPAPIAPLRGTSGAAAPAPSVSPPPVGPSAEDLRLSSQLSAAQLSPRSALVMLLSSAFDSLELRRFLADEDGLSGALPGQGVSADHLTFEAVQALGRRGRIGPALFARLRAARPGFAASIAAVEARFQQG